MSNFYKALSSVEIQRIKRAQDWIDDYFENFDGETVIEEIKVWSSLSIDASDKIHNVGNNTTHLEACLSGFTYIAFYRSLLSSILRAIKEDPNHPVSAYILSISGLVSAYEKAYRVANKNVDSILTYVQNIDIAESEFEGSFNR